MSLSTLLDLLPASRASEVAIVIPAWDKHPAVNTTYQRLQSHIQLFQQQLTALQPNVQQTLGPGSVISTSLPNDLACVVSFLGVTNAGYVCAPLNPTYTESENEWYLRDARSAIWIVPHGTSSRHLALAQRHNILLCEITFDHQKDTFTLVPTQPTSINTKREATKLTPTPSSVALLLHTSGTTSAPKAVPLTHANLCRTVVNIKNTYNIKSSDRTLLVMPLFHVHGLMSSLLTSLYCGGTVIIPAKFSLTTFWGLMTKYQCTWYSAVPTIHQILLTVDEPASFPNAKPAPASYQAHKGCPSLRFIRSCSSALPQATGETMETIYGVPVLQAYAMTEGAHQISSNPLPPQPRYHGSVGRGQGVEIAIFDADNKQLPSGSIGEVCIRGANVTSGYLNNPKANAESFVGNTGFFRTGDQGYLDKQGFLFLTGRLKELINRGGEKIAPIEIDEALVAHPLVAEAISFGAPDPKYGQVVHAAVVLKNPSTPASEHPSIIRTLQQHCGTKLSNFKIPSVIHIATTLPRTATGKIQRRHVASHFTQQQQQQQQQPIKSQL